MKLLIVDDEELTRTGVITSLDWASLGIDEVLQADDGVHGLETARLCKPEIQKSKLPSAKPVNFTPKKSIPAEARHCIQWKLLPVWHCS